MSVSCGERNHAASLAIPLADNEYARLALRALLDRGVDIPGDVAVIGCDDTKAAKLARPQLTTTQMHEQDLGRLLADSLHNQPQRGARGGSGCGVRLEDFVDEHPEFEVPVERVAAWLARLDDDV